MTADLYCFGESGNAYKAALTLQLAGLDWTPVWVDFFHGATKTPEFLRLNPMGEVPVLVDGDEVLTQSGVIQDWVIEKTGRFGGDQGGGRREVWRWVLFDNHKVSGMAGPLRFYRNFIPAEKRDEAVAAFMEGRLKSALGVLETELAHRDWLAGTEPTVADFSCCGYLYYPEPFGFERVDYPAVDAWLDRIAALPGWKHPYDLMPGNPSDRS